MATDARKTRLFTVINRAELSERIPRVPGAFHFALPFVADPAVDWNLYLDGVDGLITAPRAFLVSRYGEFLFDGTTPNTSEGLVYPTDLAAFSHVVDGADPGFADAEAAVALAKAEYLGIVIDGFDHTKDLNITVTLAAGIPHIYLQGALASASETVDPLIATWADDLGLKLFNGQVFWNYIQ